MNKKQLKMIIKLVSKEANSLGYHIEINEKGKLKLIKNKWVMSIYDNESKEWKTIAELESKPIVHEFDFDDEKIEFTYVPKEERANIEKPTPPPNIKGR